MILLLSPGYQPRCWPQITTILEALRSFDYLLYVLFFTAACFKEGNVCGNQGVGSNGTCCEGLQFSGYCYKPGGKMNLNIKNHQKWNIGRKIKNIWYIWKGLHSVIAITCFDQSLLVSKYNAHWIWLAAVKAVEVAIASAVAIFEGNLVEKSNT